MKINPTQRNKLLLLQRKPLTACEVTPSWNSSGWLADFVQIYPNKIKKTSFENQREKFLQLKQDNANAKKAETNFKGTFSEDDEDAQEKLRQNQERNLELKRKREQQLKQELEIIEEQN